MTCLLADGFAPILDLIEEVKGDLARHGKGGSGGPQ